MRKINFAKAHQVLSEKEMKNVLGGSGSSDCSSNTCGPKICCDPQWNWCVNGYCQRRP